MTQSVLKQNTIAPAKSARGDALIAKNIATLGQLYSGIENISEEIYTSSPANSSSIGMHVRHIIEFYQAFLKAICPDQADEICYDGRERKAVFESSKTASLNEIKNIQAHIEAITCCDTPLTMDVVIDPDAPMEALQTTVQRELYHVLDHTVHHMAIIKMTSSQFGILFEQDFGLANATKSHQQKANA